MSAVVYKMPLKLVRITRNSTTINWQGCSKEGIEGDIIPPLTLEEGDVKKAIAWVFLFGSRIL